MLLTWGGGRIDDGVSYIDWYSITGDEGEGGDMMVFDFELASHDVL